MSCLKLHREIAESHTHGALLVECLSPLTRPLNRAHGSTQPTKSFLQSKRKWCRNSQNQTSSQKSSTRKGSGWPKSLKPIMVLENFSTGKTSDSGYRVPAALSDKPYRKHFIAGPHQWAANSANYIFRLQAPQLHSRLIPLSEQQHRLLLSLMPERWSRENHQNTVNHPRVWMSAKVSSITGPHQCGSQLALVDFFLLTSLSLISKWKVGPLSLKRCFWTWCHNLFRQLIQPAEPQSLDDWGFLVLPDE